MHCASHTMTSNLPDWVQRIADSLRFIRPDQALELIQLWHLSRTSRAGKKDAKGHTIIPNHHARMIETARMFHQEHPEISETAAYKDLDFLLSPEGAP